jgi:hypothetical protein
LSLKKTKIDELQWWGTHIFWFPSRMTHWTSCYAYVSMLMFFSISCIVGFTTFQMLCIDFVVIRVSSSSCPRQTSSQSSRYILCPCPQFELTSLTKKHVQELKSYNSHIWIVIKQCT